MLSQLYELNIALELHLILCIINTGNNFSIPGYNVYKIIYFVLKNFTIHYQQMFVITLKKLKLVLPKDRHYSNSHFYNEALYLQEIGFYVVFKKQCRIKTYLP